MRWSVSLGTMLDDATDRKFETIFARKAEGVILLVFECTINPQNLIKIVVAIFEKIKIFNFFSHVNYP